MSKIVQKIVHEVKALIPVTLYFLFADILLAVTQMVLLREYGIEVVSIGQAVVMALIVAKVVLIMDMLPLMNRFHDRPPIYNVVWSTVMYLLATIVLEVGEHIVKAWIHTGGLATGYAHFVNETEWPRFILTQFWMLVLLFNYCLFRSAGKTVGPGGLTRLLLRR